MIHYNETLPIGAVGNSAYQTGEWTAQLKTAPTIHGERKCLSIFMIHYKKELSNAGLLAAKRCLRCGRIIRFVPQQIRALSNFMPRTGDRQRNPRTLDIHKERRAVR